MENQVDQNLVNSQPLIPVQNKVNYWMVSTIVLVILIVVTVAILLLSRNQKQNLNIESNVSPTPTSHDSASTQQTSNIPTSTNTDTSDKVNDLQTYTNNALTASVYTVTFPIGQSGWILKHTTSVDPYYTQNQNLSDELTIEQNTRKSGPGACLFKDSPNFDGPGQKFNSYVEFQLGSRVARRAEIETTTQEGKDKYIICQKEKSSDYFVSITEFGYISYDVSTGSNVEDVDSIIKTLKKI